MLHFGLKEIGLSYGQQNVYTYLPLKIGSLFSTQALGPSWASSVLAVMS
jgi:hypothetical protein